MNLPPLTNSAERDIRALTYESKQTTERQFGTMPDDRRFEVFESIPSKKTIDARSLSESEKTKIFDSTFEVIGDAR